MGPQPGRSPEPRAAGAHRSGNAFPSALRSQGGWRDRLWRRAATLRRDRSGNAAAEFAMILPAFLAMFGACIQYGTLAITYNSMLLAARSAAREVAVGKETHGNASNKSKGKRPNWVSDGEWSAQTRDRNADEVETVITVPGEAATVLAILPVPAQLSVTVVMDKES